MELFEVLTGDEKFWDEDRKSFNQNYMKVFSAKR
jgi:hypothetical protein